MKYFSLTWYIRGINPLNQNIELNHIPSKCGSDQASSTYVPSDSGTISDLINQSPSFLLVVVIMVLFIVDMSSVQRYIPQPNMSYPDLTSIGSSFEMIVNRTAGGTVLKNVMEFSENAVSHSSTIVRTSGLKCRVPLSEKLDVVAKGTKSSIRELSIWSNKVSGTLEKSVNLTLRLWANINIG